MLQSRPRMIRSMTGYGQGAAEAPGIKVTVELRSVNNRFADLKLRLPDVLLPFEHDLRRKILATVKRGRIDVDLRLERTGAQASPLALNRPLVAAALQAMRIAPRGVRRGRGLGSPDGDVRSRHLRDGRTPAPRSKTPGGRRSIARWSSALTALDGERRREGGLLQADLVRAGRADEGHRRHDSRARDRGAGRAPKEDRRARAASCGTQVALDPARIAQEAAFLADRSDVTEEIVRLTGHLEHALALLAETGGEPVGKRLEFLLQEIHRETNTIASKSADLGINRQALSLKAEAEKIREQIQNLE